MDTSIIKKKPETIFFCHAPIIPLSRILSCQVRFPTHLILELFKSGGNPVFSCLTKHCQSKKPKTRAEANRPSSRGGSGNLTIKALSSQPARFRVHQSSQLSQPTESVQPNFHTVAHPSYSEYLLCSEYCGIPGLLLFGCTLYTLWLTHHHILTTYSTSHQSFLSTPVVRK